MMACVAVVLGAKMIFPRVSGFKKAHRIGPIPAMLLMDLYRSTQAGSVDEGNVRI